MLHAESLLLQLAGGIKQEPDTSVLFYSHENQFYSHQDASPPLITEFGAKLEVPPQATQNNNSRSSSVGSGSTGSTGSSRRKSYPCDLCPAMFGSKMELEEHSNSHTGEKPFECDICNARFNRRSTLWNHKRIHSDQKPFRCPICSMHFKWKNSLKCHKEMHLRKNETGPLDAEEFRIQLLSPSKRGRTARGGSRKRGGSATAAASSNISVSPLATATGPRGNSPDFSMLEDPTGYSAANLLASQDGHHQHMNGQQRYDPMSHHDHRMTAPRTTSILQQALQQPVSPALSLAVHHQQPPPHSQQANGGSSYQIYVQSLPAPDTKPMAPPTGLLQPATTTYAAPPSANNVSQSMKLSPPTGTTPMQNSRGESPIASGGQVPTNRTQAQSQQQTQHLIQYLSPTSGPDDNNNSTRSHHTTIVSSGSSGLPPVSFYSPQNLGDHMPRGMDQFTSSLLSTPASQAGGHPPGSQGPVTTSSAEDYMPNVDFINMVPSAYQFTSHAAGQDSQRMEHGYVVRELQYNEW